VVPPLRSPRTSAIGDTIVFTAVFSVVNALVLRPLPVKDADRLAIVSSGSTAPSLQQYSYSTFDAIRRQVPTLDGALAWAGLGKMTLSHDGSSEVVYDGFVSGDYYETLGVPTLLGRPFTMADDLWGGHRQCLKNCKPSVIRLQIFRASARCGARERQSD
jgi:hypothetical protein